MRVTIDEEQGVVELDQSRYALEIYNSYRDQSVRIGAVSTPMSSTVKLSRTNGDPEYMANKDYRGAVSRLTACELIFLVAKGGSRPNRG